MPRGRKSRETLLRERAAVRGYTLEQDEQGRWYAVAAGGTRWGPMESLDEVEEFLPAG